MRRVIVLLVAMVAVSACLGSDFADSVEGPWQLTSGTVDGEEIPIIDSHPITITFDDDQVSGTASCNGYGGTFDLDGSSISLGNLAMTEMACFPEETMEAEQMYAGALIRVDNVSVDGDLTLTGPGVELVFSALAPVPEAALTNTVWVLDGLVTGDTVTSVSGRSTVEFFTDGSVLGDTGCRPFSGQYVVNGAEVLLTELAADGNECEPGLSDQDNHVISVLGDGFRVEIEGEMFTAWSVGEEGLVYRADS
ncbi:MAG: META domain-containing protein [Acidimicrobiia bacterium]